MLLLSAALLFAALVFWGDRVAGSGSVPGVRLWREEAGAIYVSAPLARYGSQTISLWKREKEDSYVLFLPSFWEADARVRMWTKEGDALELDGKALSFGGTRDLTAGMHTLTVNGRPYALEVMTSANIPALFVEMDNKKLADLQEQPYTEQYGAKAMLVLPDGRVGTEGKIAGFRVRGNTSADWPKKPFQMTMQQATDFLGMGSAVKWNLLSNWSDRTLLRNKITYDMGAQAGMSWTPESAFVDLYLNGAYQGCYQISEKVEIAPERVHIRNLEDFTLYEPTEQERDSDGLAEITKADPAAGGVAELENGIVYRGYATQIGTDDITGGYLLEIERPSRIFASASFFITQNGQPVTVKRPKYADHAEVAYIAGVWQTFEDAVYAPDGVNPGTGLHYTAYIDRESFVRKYLVEEIVRNYDASSTSQYFYKDTDTVDGLLYAGPVWDYDMSLGNPIMNPRTNQHYISSVSPYGLFAALPMDEFSIWYRMYEHEDFQKLAAETYARDFLPLLKELENGRIDALADELQPSALMDGIRWDRNRGEDSAAREAEYRGHVEQLKTFLVTREHYLTGLWIEGRESRKVYLDGGNADMYISYVEGLVGDVLEEPLAPEMEGYTFVEWLNGYTKEPYDFTRPYDGSDLYFTARYRSNTDGSILTVGE